MDKIIFVDFQTKIASAWLNAVSDTVWDALGEAKTPSDARQFIGAVEEAPDDGKSYLRASLGWLEAATALTHNQLGGRDSSDAHPTSSITGLDNALAGKAMTVHTHTGSQITGITATQVSFTPVGTISATSVQAAIAELDTETQEALAIKSSIATTVTKTSNVGAANIPTGLVTDRPASPVNGQFRYNSTDGVFEGYKAGGWAAFSQNDQSWQDFSATRALATDYTNTTGQQIQVIASIRNGNIARCSVEGVVDGVAIATAENVPSTTEEKLCITFNVPAGATYQVRGASTGAPSIWTWFELRD